MGGLVIDIVLDFVARSLLRCSRWFRSTNWPRITARVTRSEIVDPNLGCIFVRLCYEAISERLQQEECVEIPFFFRESAKSFARAYPDGCIVCVREAPHGSESRFFESDQKKKAVESTMK